MGRAVKLCLLIKKRLITPETVKKEIVKNPEISVPATSHIKSCFTKNTWVHFQLKLRALLNLIAEHHKRSFEHSLSRKAVFQLCKHELSTIMPSERTHLSRHSTKDIKLKIKLARDFTEEDKISDPLVYNRQGYGIVLLKRFVNM